MNDLFQLSFTHVRTSPRGSGQKRKLKPGHSNPETFKCLKGSVISIDNKDELCCAHAIVTAKAKWMITLNGTASEEVSLSREMKQSSCI